MSSHVEPSPYPPDMWVLPEKGQVTQDVAAKAAAPSGAFRLALAASGILAVLAIAGFAVKASTYGFSEHGPWGYYAAIFSFIFLVTSSAPLFAVAFRITKNHWRRPVSRIAEIFAVLGILNVILYIPLIYILPAINNPTFGPDSHGELAIRRTIWMEVPIGAPHWWNLLGILSLAVAALALLWLSATPDLAEARSTTPGFRGALYRILSGHWYGTKKQWIHQKASLAILGALYFMMVIFVQFLIVSDFAMSLVPGWKDSILPPLYTVTGFQSAISLVLIIAFIMRRWGNYGNYIGISPFWSASKVQLGLTLLWTYHLFAFFITMWYGRLETEQNLIKYLIFESYTGIFWANVILIFFIPFFMLIWNPLRKSALGPALAGLSILCGNLMFQLRMFVAAFNSGDIYDLGMTRVPPPVFPQIWDIFMVVGGLGLVAFIFLLTTKIVPLISVWEVKEGAMYQRKDRLFRGEYMVLAKPE